MSSPTELVPGLFTWTAFERIGRDVTSAYVGGEARLLIDPMLPDGGVEDVAAIGRPKAIALTNRHHLRHSESFLQAFGCPVLCHEHGLHEFAGGGPDVQGFSFGDERRHGARGRGRPRRPDRQRRQGSARALCRGVLSPQRGGDGA